jgi:hypothetical protein
VFKVTNTGAGYALLGVSDFNGIGVGGFCTTTGVNYGVWGQSDSSFGTGVYGYARRLLAPRTAGGLSATA